MVVVKALELPLRVGVTARAVHAQLGLVLVVFLMASDTGEGGCPEMGRVAMTGLAGQRWRGVGIAHWKTRLCMVETTVGELPSLFGMAVTARPAQVGLVLIVLFMATDARH